MYGSKHEKLKDIQPHDRVVVEWCDSVGEASALERYLIIKLRPPLNVYIPST